MKRNKQKLSTVPVAYFLTCLALYQVRSDFSFGKNEMRLKLKPEARALGLTVDDLARQVNAGVFGTQALRLQRGPDDIRVKVRYTTKERSTLSSILKASIRTPEGYEIPLRSVAEVQYALGYSTIIRTDGNGPAGEDVNSHGDLPSRRCFICNDPHPCSHPKPYGHS